MLSQLKEKQLVWLANEKLIDRKLIETGYEEFDAHYQGLPAHGLIEIQTMHGWGEIRLLIGYLKHKQEQGLISIIRPPGILNSEFLLQHGIKLDQILLINPKSGTDALWAAEQCLKSGLCSSVLLWKNRLSIKEAKRINLACEQGHASLFLIRCVQTSLVSGSKIAIQLQPESNGVRIKIKRRKGRSLNLDPIINSEPLWQPSLIQYWRKAPLKSVHFEG